MSTCLSCSTMPEATGIESKTPSMATACRRKGCRLPHVAAAVRAALVLGCWCSTASGLGFDDVRTATRLRGHHHAPQGAVPAAPAPKSDTAGPGPSSSTNRTAPTTPNTRPPKNGTAQTRPAAVPGAGRPPKPEGRVNTPPVPPHKVGRSLGSGFVRLGNTQWAGRHAGREAACG